MLYPPRVRLDAQEILNSFGVHARKCQPDREFRDVLNAFAVKIEGFLPDVSPVIAVAVWNTVLQDALNGPVSWDSAELWNVKFYAEVIPFFPENFQVQVQRINDSLPAMLLERLYGKNKD